MFADSLPDGWGRLLLDRALARKGVDLNRVTTLARLAYVGTDGRGALTYDPGLPYFDEVTDSDILLDELAGQVASIWNDDLDELPALLRMGGSSGGTRPKIQVLYSAETDHLIPSVFPAPPGYEAWIIKFGSSGLSTFKIGVRYW